VLTGYRKGELIFTEGDPVDGLRIIARGTVKIFKLSLEGKEQILTHFSKGEPIGESAVFAGGTFPASAMSIEDSLILCIPRAEIQDLIFTDPQVGMNMLAVLSRRLQIFARLIEDLSLKEISARLAKYLLDILSRNPGSSTLALAMPKSQLALRLGTVPETLSRILTRMKDRGIITVEGRRITILKLEILRGLAAGFKL